MFHCSWASTNCFDPCFWEFWAFQSKQESNDDFPRRREIKTLFSLCFQRIQEKIRRTEGFRLGHAILVGQVLGIRARDVQGARGNGWVQHYKHSHDCEFLPFVPFREMRLIITLWLLHIPQILANKLSAKRLPKAFNDILVDELTEKGETFVRRNEELGNILYYGMNVSVYTEILADVLQGNVPPEFQDGIFALFKGVSNCISRSTGISGASLPSSFRKTALPKDHSLSGQRGTTLETFCPSTTKPNSTTGLEIIAIKLKGRTATFSGLM